MEGMDMGIGMFQVTNMELARDFWYLVAGVVGGLTLVRGVNYVQTLVRFGAVIPHAFSLVADDSTGYGNARANLSTTRADPWASSSSGQR